MLEHSSIWKSFKSYWFEGRNYLLGPLVSTLKNWSENLLVSWQNSHETKNASKNKRRRRITRRRRCVRKQMLRATYVTWKRFILKRHLFQVIVRHGHHKFLCFFAALYLPHYSVVPVLANAATKFRSAVKALAAWVPSITNFHESCCLNNLSNPSALRSFYVQKGILRIFYFNTISLIVLLLSYVALLICFPTHLIQKKNPRLVYLVNLLLLLLLLLCLHL